MLTNTTLPYISKCVHYALRVLLLESPIRLLDQPVSSLVRGDTGETANLRSVSTVERTR